MLKQYKITFNPSSLALFLIIMLPNFYWCFVPATNDILRAPSATETMDTVASIFQIIMIASLCLIANKGCRKIKFTPDVAIIIASVCLYYFAWVCYYLAIINTFVILGLCVMPCLAFLLFSINRKNIFALISAAIFSFCHLAYGIINFI